MPARGWCGYHPDHGGLSDLPFRLAGALFVFALVGVVWAGVWYWYYRDNPAEHKSTNEAEQKLIQDALGSAPKRKTVPWKAILSSPQMWVLASTYFCYGYALNMFLAWFPKYLEAVRA